MAIINSAQIPKSVSLSLSSRAAITTNTHMIMFSQDLELSEDLDRFFDTLYNL